MATQTFSHKVLNIVSKIPKGETRTYKQVAELAGSPKAFRAVGTILSENYDPKIPCHRVIKSDGSLGQYNRGTNAKRQKLISEGVILSKD
jgi:O-6-methylguanine DNA methyltransferase